MSGGGKSSSSSSTSTSNADNRGIADNGSLVVSGSSQAQVTMTDLGAVNSAIQFAQESGNAVIQADSTNFGKLLDAGLAVLGQGQKNLDSSSSQLAAAYTDAKGGNTNNQYIAMAGIAAAVAVAYSFSKR